MPLKSADRVRVLVANGLGPRLFWLTQLIGRQADMEVVADDLENPIDVLLAVRETGADVLVFRLPEAIEEPGICINLLSEYPRLLILGLSPKYDRAFLYQQSMSKQALPEVSGRSILNAIRTGDVNPMTH